MEAPFWGASFDQSCTPGVQLSTFEILGAGTVLTHKLARNDVPRRSVAHV